MLRAAAGPQYTNAVKFTRSGHIRLRLREVPGGFVPEPEPGMAAVVVAPPPYSQRVAPSRADTGAEAAAAAAQQQQQQGGVAVAGTAADGAGGAASRGGDVGGGAAVLHRDGWPAPAAPRWPSSEASPAAAAPASSSAAANGHAASASASASAHEGEGGAAGPLAAGLTSRGSGSLLGLGMGLASLGLGLARGVRRRSSAGAGALGSGASGSAPASASAASAASSAALASGSGTATSGASRSPGASCDHAASPPEPDCGADEPWAGHALARAAREGGEGGAPGPQAHALSGGADAAAGVGRGSVAAAAAAGGGASGRGPGGWAPSGARWILFEVVDTGALGRWGLRGAQRASPGAGQGSPRGPAPTWPSPYVTDACRGAGGGQPGTARGGVPSAWRSCWGGVGRQGAAALPSSAARPRLPSLLRLGRSRPLPRPLPRPASTRPGYHARGPQDALPRVRAGHGRRHAQAAL